MADLYVALQCPATYPRQLAIQQWGATLVVHMDWMWVVLAATVPLLPAFAVAWPLWRKGVADSMGAIAGSAVILVAVVGFVAREFGEVHAAARTCDELEKLCHFRPDAFSRYAIFAAIGMAQVFLNFGIGLIVEERQRRNRDYAPEWRR
jgi:hypothetical protein